MGRWNQKSAYARAEQNIAYEDGKRAFKAGVDRDTNPFGMRHALASYWFDGFDDAKHEAHKNERAGAEK